MPDLAEACGLSVCDTGFFLDKAADKQEIFAYAPYLKHPELLQAYPKTDHTDIVLGKIGHKWTTPRKNHLERLSESLLLSL